MGNLFHTNSSLCHISSTVLDLVGWRVSISAIHNHVFSMVDIYGDCAGQDSRWIPCISTKIITQSATCCLALTCWKIAFGRPVRQGTATERKISDMNLSAFKLLLIRTKDVLVRYPIASLTITPGAGSPCKLATCCLLGAYWRTFGQQNTTSRTGTHLKRWHCAIFEFNFVNRSSKPRVNISHYTVLSREVEIMVTELTDHAAANVDALYGRKLNVLQKWPFPDKWSVMWLYGFAGLTLQYVCSNGH